ncbi:acid protease [Macroventuria anomochaeta]|uniref:Acid protease n=1 Tax=Macroventuria anomochaeta TaxID=301207 RepID=A0ACB6RTY5_9PLEO|nr:acid protease [Macroventuria anomochaeta]KAF2624518.1 acid protease [Macroventuria anomochaeta]
MGALTPSSEYLASLSRNAIRKVKRQNDDVADVREDLVTLGGRVHMIRVTLGSRVYSLVIDTGSSDTWAAQAGLVCKDANGATVATSMYRFGPLYNTIVSQSYKAYNSRQAFGVNYTSGAGYAPRQTINQKIGIVQQGYWDGDGTSSGLMGLAYSRLASGSSTIGYEAVIFSLIKIDGFSIAAPTGSIVTPQNYAASSQNIIVDSDTTPIYLLDRIAEYVATLFQSAATYNANSRLSLVNCAAVAPRVDVTVGGKTSFISTNDLMNRGSGAVGGVAAGGSSTQCVLAIARTAGGVAMLGDSWMKNVLVVFDLGGTRLGLLGRRCIRWETRRGGARVAE